jgi:ferritin-like metal-binding protein YciE
MHALDMLGAEYLSQVAVVTGTGSRLAAGGAQPAVWFGGRANNWPFRHWQGCTLKDIYYAEKAILKALPKMAKKASSNKLQSAFTKHQKETERQVERLDQVFSLLGKRASGKKCPAIDGIIEEGEEVMKEAKDDTIRDAAMLAAAQSVEHYEISRYGTLVAWAEKMEMSEAAQLLEATLEEEKATDEKLSELADSEINVEAEETDDEDEERLKRRASGRR